MAATKPLEHAPSAQVSPATVATPSMSLVQTPRSRTQRPSEQLLDERGASTPNMGPSWLRGPRRREVKGERSGNHLLESVGAGGSAGGCLVSREARGLVNRVGPTAHTEPWSRRTTQHAHGTPLGQGAPVCRLDL
eukprot:scaffold92169_cov67-Phaeocystis_antarctica.AAC.2